MTADLTLDWVREAVGALSVPGGGFGFLVSPSGTFVSHLVAPGADPEATSFWHDTFVSFIQHVPYWMVLWVTVLTILSGVLYMRQYKNLIKREFKLRSEHPPS